MAITIYRDGAWRRDEPLFYSREQLLSNWQNTIRLLQTNFQHLLQRKMQADIAPLMPGAVPVWSVDRATRSIKAVCPTISASVAVQIYVEGPWEAPVRMHTICTCRDGNYGFACRHATVVVNQFAKQFAADPTELTVSIVGEKRDDWQIALERFNEALAIPPAPTAPAPAKPAARTPICFQITITSGHLQIFAFSMKEKKRQGLLPYRQIRWSALNKAEKFDLTPEDLTVLQEAKKRISYSSDYLDPNAAVHVLAAMYGHPRVFFRELPVEVRPGKLGVGFADEKRDWRVVPMLDDLALDQWDEAVVNVNQGAIVAFHPSPRRLTLAFESRPMVRLVAQFAQQPTSIPPQGRKACEEVIQRLESRMHVALPRSLKGETVPADERLWLRLDRSDARGAKVELRVRPAPEGPFLPPGEGTAEIAGAREGRRISCLRDLASEASRAAAMAGELNLGRFKSPVRATWVLEEDDDVLDLLDLVRTRGDDGPVVAWADDDLQEQPTGASRRMNVLGEISATAMQIEVKDHRDWFGLNGSIEIGGRQFPIADLLRAIKSGRRYVDLGDGQYGMIADELRERLSAAADMMHLNRGKLEFNALAAPALSQLLEEHQTFKASKKWKESLARLERASRLDPQVPATLSAELRDYQVDGFKWLRRLSEWGVGGCLADDMGLGKTVQALAVLVDRREIGPTLVVAPVSVGFNWERECQRFAPTLRPILYRDTDRVEFLKSLGPGDLLISSYYLLQQHAEELTAVEWGTLVLDEAQAVKNSQTKTAQVVRELNADWRLALTGTPVENHLGELWSVFRAVAPGLFGSWERFREVFGEPIEKQKDASRKLALSRVVQPFILRRTKSEVLKELPPRTEIQLSVELSAEERRLYENARLWAMTHLNDLVEKGDDDQRFQVLAALTRLRQLACHPRLVDKQWKRSSAKLDLFLETVDELREGRHRALVFSQFTSHLALLREALDERQIAYQYLDGSTPPKNRQVAVDAFQRGEGDLFLISLKAGGSGLNLAAADYVLHLDPWWNPAVEDQASDRAHRIGQTRPVTVYRFVAKDTIEEQILQLHGEKRGLMTSILEGTDQAGKLSTRELIALIKKGGQE